MKGCLSFIIKTVIAVLVFFGLLHLGVIDFIKDKIQEYKSETKKKNQERIPLSSSGSAKNSRQYPSFFAFFQN